MSKLKPHILFFLLSSLLSFALYAQDSIIVDGISSSDPRDMILFDPDSLATLSFNERHPYLRDHLFPKRVGVDTRTVLRSMDKTLARMDASKEPELYIEIEYFILQLQSRLNQIDNKEELNGLIELRDKARKKGFRELHALFEYDLAEFTWNQTKELNQAMVHYDVAYNIARAIPDSTFYLKQDLIYKLGEKYFVLGDYANAKVYLKEALEVDNPNFHMGGPAININNNLGLAYLSTSQLDEAQESFERALFHAEQVGNKSWIGNLSGNLGHVFYLKGDLDAAEKWTRRDIQISKARGSKASAASAMLSLAGMKMKSGDMESGIALVDSSMALKPLDGFLKKKLLYPLLCKIEAYRGNWKAAAAYLDSTQMVQDSLANREHALQKLRLHQRLELEETRTAITKAQADAKRRQQQFYALAIGLFLSLLAGSIIYIQRQKTEKARKRSDQLLLNILPADVAKELKDTGSSQARRFSEVTVLFSDFVGFTKISESLSPKELVDLLHTYFKAFDEIVERNGLEKIKTVGDAYICCAGLPIPVEDHARRVVQCALEMQEHMKSSPHGWTLRIGVNTGPVVAGIVGIKKFAYDIWGDTVNTAARLEHNCEPGRVNVSATSYDLIKDHFACSHRGQIEAKNKGALNMYYVEGRRGE
jgi:class 3 adenylate cyclase/Tfp pilus assembly protein PilF